MAIIGGATLTKDPERSSSTDEELYSASSDLLARIVSLCSGSLVLRCHEQGGITVPDIAVIAPYTEMANLAQGLAAECGASVSVAGGNLAAGIDMARDAQCSGIRVVVSRGGTALLICGAADVFVPVVSVPVLPNDFVRAVHKATQFSRVIGVVRFINTMPPNTSVLSRVFGARIMDLPITTADEALARVSEATQAGAGVFVGGVTCVTAAKALGYPAVLIESSPDSLAMALSEAASLAAKTTRLQHRVQLLRDALNLAGDAIIVTDSEGRAVELNRAAKRATGADGLRALGQSVSDFASGQEAARHSSVSDGQCLGSVLMLPKTQPPLRPTAGAASAFGDIIGSSMCVRECIRLASRYAGSDFDVLITGETGTGKELFAQSIHNASPRRNGPFVMVNCAALPESLLESELFGYASGSFTGANKGGKVGLFAQAQGGTIFLDEVSAMPVSVQQRFLRVLEDRHVRPVGDDRVISLNIRVIAATNRDIRSLVAAGSFLPDLLYRLDVLKLVLPPLRARREDVPDIAQCMLREFRRSCGSGPMGFTAEAMSLLMRYDWPGNVRELRNVVQRLVVCSDSQLVSAEEIRYAIGLADEYEEIMPVLSQSLQSSQSAQSIPCSQGAAQDHDAQLPKHSPQPQDARGLKARIKHHELDSILGVLEECGGSRSLAAQRLGISRVTLWRKLKGHVASLNH